ncbi:hypothetical protein WICPIJ_007475 [Wickerhamomyces pijperi]|uniref:UBC core domain-containing protein n=1 Tax=Wickerhamomyces pijperi TaxID=599730 RepID=A0A9P8TJX2_WICPI|nr:hypothetical protein WICPIJ_007475 [Wickerhamomyces pijperi]
MNDLSNDSTPNLPNSPSTPVARSKSTSPKPLLDSIFSTPLKSIAKSFQRMSMKTRVLKELKTMEAAPKEGFDIELTDNLCLLYADITVANNPLYPADEKYRLKIMIPEEYPFTNPVCHFILDPSANVTKIPMHPHIYSNGHICLDLLGPAWTPAYTIMSLIVAIQSILASNDTSERPEGDENYVQRAPKDPSKTRWVYHDDNV